MVVRIRDGIYQWYDLFFIFFDFERCYTSTQSIIHLCGSNVHVDPSQLSITAGIAVILSPLHQCIQSLPLYCIVCILEYHLSFYSFTFMNVYASELVPHMAHSDLMILGVSRSTGP